MNLPTKFTVSRIVLAVITIFLLLFPYHTVGVDMPRFFIGGIYVKLEYLIACFLFILASITDAIDGHLARKMNLISDLGKMLDAIADKLLVNSILIILACHGFISVWIPVIIVLRDIVVDALKMEVASHGKVVGAIYSGKVKTTFLMVGIVLSLLYNLPFEIWGIEVANFCLYIACVMAIASAIEYAGMTKKALKEKTKIETLS